MPLPSAEDILSLSAEAIADFICDQTSSKTLHRVMTQLNIQLSSTDEEMRIKAGRALEHLGFPIYA